MKSKIKTTSFWLGISGAIVILLNSISNIFNVEICTQEIENIIITIASILVFLGVITKKNENDKKESTKEELLQDLQDDSKVDD